MMMTADPDAYAGQLDTVGERITVALIPVAADDLGRSSSAKLEDRSR